ncbi:DNA-3-methyladenine glycosylase [Nocardioides convexus]|uniref:DNA-3-methyladenine glycosylase n=1 Tax=Nocardioides convexus TaxID=2712224 RepID=UPI0024186ECA|nr:DNA-3-methyladenine glycosylase [Nocardioides convexus]
MTCRLARGPGNLAQALGITLADLGADLLAEHPPGEDFTGVRLGPERRTRPRIAAGPRVGVSKAADVPWRFWVVGDPAVSAYRRSPRAPAPGTTLPAREH